MAASLTISAPISGSPLLITDSSSGITVSSRIITIYNADGDLLDTIDMGASLTTTYEITGDQWLRFVLTLNGGAASATVDYLSTNWFFNGLVTVAKSCGCGGSSNTLCSDATKAMLAEKAAGFYFAYGFAINADSRIKDADALIL